MEPRNVSPGHAWQWILGGFALFRKSPARWLVVLLMLLLATKIVSLVPVVSIVFILLLPVFVAGLMEGCRALERGEQLEISHLTRGFNKNAPQLVTVGGVWLVGNIVIMYIVVNLGGESLATLAKALSDNQNITPQTAEKLQPVAATAMRALMIGMLVSLPLVMALLYAPLLVYFHDARPFAAMRTSLIACLRNMLPMLVYGMLFTLGMFLAMPFATALGQYDLSLWLLAPVVVPSLYMSYKDIFLAATPAAALGN